MSHMELSLTVGLVPRSRRVVAHTNAPPPDFRVTSWLGLLVLSKTTHDTRTNNAKTRKDLPWRFARVPGNFNVAAMLRNFNSIEFQRIRQSLSTCSANC